MRTRARPPAVPDLEMLHVRTTSFVWSIAYSVSPSTVMPAECFIEEWLYVCTTYRARACTAIHVTWPARCAGGTSKLLVEMAETVSPAPANTVCRAALWYTPMGLSSDTEATLLPSGS
jgi:hypothetical protein